MTEYPWASATALQTGAIAAVFAALCWLLFADTAATDLRALWIAGHFIALGAEELVYAGNAGAFDLLSAGDWDPYLAAGAGGASHPFAQPPLWPAVTAALVPWLPFGAFKAASGLIAPLLMVALLWRAARMAEDPDLPVPLMVAVGAAIMLAILPGTVALQHTPAQILAAYLTLTALERARAGAPRHAGIALGLAASLSLTPALLALLWLAAGHWRAARAFALTAGLMAALSIAVAGWPLHQAYLAELTVIRTSILVSPFTWGLDALLAATPLAPATEAGGHIAARPDPWLVLSESALVCVLILAALHLRRASRTGAREDALVWPICLIALTFVLPLSWGYGYLAGLAFLPQLLDRLGLRLGVPLVLAACLPLTPAAVRLVLAHPSLLPPPEMLGAVTLAALGGLFAAAIARCPRRRALRPLHAPPVSL